jgi:hypothetical protein
VGPPGGKSSGCCHLVLSANLVAAQSRKVFTLRLVTRHARAETGLIGTRLGGMASSLRRHFVLNQDLTLAEPGHVLPDLAAPAGRTRGCQVASCRGKARRTESKDNPPALARLCWRCSPVSRVLYNVDPRRRQ